MIAQFEILPIKPSSFIKYSLEAFGVVFFAGTCMEILTVLMQEPFYLNWVRHQVWIGNG